METRALLCVMPVLNTHRATWESLSSRHWVIYHAETIESAIKLLASRTFHVAVVDIENTGADGLHRYWPELKKLQPYINWIALLPHGLLNNREICEYICDRFYDYHTHPIDLERFLTTLGHAYGMAAIAEATKGQMETNADKQGLIGDSQAIKEVDRKLLKFARVDAPALLTGETGTGKELAAYLIHARSQRAHKPFLAINTGALPASLIQSELFGYEKGAFTGAHQRTVGRFEAANGGTLFLDEIGDLPLELQVNLLRVLQEGQVERLGSHQAIDIDVRIIAATNINLQQAVAEGRFREDLYYRLNVLHVTIPPLRQRESDLELLAHYFLMKFANEANRNIIGFTSDALKLMRRYDWPGNVRELMNRIRGAVIMSETRLISPTDLGIERRSRQMKTLEAARSAAEREVIEDCLRYTSRNVSGAARILGVSRGTLYNLLQKYQIDPA